MFLIVEGGRVVFFGWCSYNMVGCETGGGGRNESSLEAFICRILAIL